MSRARPRQERRRPQQPHPQGNLRGTEAGLPYGSGRLDIRAGGGLRDAGGRFLRLRGGRGLWSAPRDDGGRGSHRGRGEVHLNGGPALGLGHQGQGDGQPEAESQPGPAPPFGPVTPPGGASGQRQKDDGGGAPQRQAAQGKKAHVLRPPLSWSRRAWRSSSSSRPIPSRASAATKFRGEPYSRSSTERLSKAW